MIRHTNGHSSQFPKRAIAPPTPIPATWDAMVKALPRLIDLERRAYRYRGSRDIWNAYSALKRDLERLAGWECSRIELATPRHYDVALQRIAKALGV